MRRHGGQAACVIAQDRSLLKLLQHFEFTNHQLM
jgi:hypothetical protein